MTAPETRERIHQLLLTIFSRTFNTLLKRSLNRMNVVDAAIKSDTGSAKNTAKTLSAKKFGRI